MTAARDPLSALPTERRSWLVRMVATLLLASPFRALKAWPAAVVIVCPENPRVMARADFASWLQSNDLPALARECTRRHVGAGQALVYLESDQGVGFVVLDVARELMLLRAAS